MDVLVAFLWILGAIWNDILRIERPSRRTQIEIFEGVNPGTFQIAPKPIKFVICCQDTI